MNKVVLLQSPAHLYEVVPIFYAEANAFGYFDRFYIVTNQKSPYGLGDNCEVIQLDSDLGRAENFLQGVEHIKEDVFTVMCDDHIIQQDYLNLDPFFEEMKHNPTIGRMQLSPASQNYFTYMGTNYIPDYKNIFEPYDRGFRFYVNFQPSLWRKEFFKYCVGGGQNRNVLEFAAANRGRRNRDYISGFIHEHAVRVGNFYASCKVHTVDSSFDKARDVAHYREEFVAYAQKHNSPLDDSKRVYVKRTNLTASVPLNDYLLLKNSEEALRKFEILQNPFAEFMSRYSKKMKHAVQMWTAR